MNANFSNFFPVGDKRIDKDVLEEIRRKYIETSFRITVEDVVLLSLHSKFHVFTISESGPVMGIGESVGVPPTLQAL